MSNPLTAWPLPAGWESRSLGDLVSRVTRRNDIRNGNVLTVSARDGLVNQEAFFNRRIASTDLSPYFLLEHGDYAYNKSYSAGFPVGVIRRLDLYPQGVVSPLYICFRPNAHSVNSDYLAHYFQSGLLDDDIALIAKEGARNHGLLNVSVSDFFSIPIRVPSLPEQIRIAKILDAADEAIRSTEQLIVKLELAKQGLLRDLLADGLGKSARLGDGNRHPAKLVDGSGLQYPASWSIATLGDVCEICDEARYPISSEDRFTQSGKFPYYGPTGVLDYIDHYRYDDKYALIGEDGDHFLKFAVRPMTQLISGKFNVNNHAHVVRGGPNCLTEWFWLFFLHRDITIHLTRQGVGRFKLSQANLLKLTIAVPPLPEQAAIVDYFFKYEAQITSERSLLAKLRLLKDGLVDDLLTGRVSVGAPA